MKATSFFFVRFYEGNLITCYINICHILNLTSWDIANLMSTTIYFRINIKTYLQCFRTLEENVKWYKMFGSIVDIFFFFYKRG
ncbi:hypothetical protein MtrunA17_Chr8g0374411 [Medicago truncatula]|uniref:Uncharacterized protein n=1 Tax=Medicago truncatula TaxID=3880 RepID=A0A396GME7_MEDTR|nr:hypothetical protein MtrunA17_Chr8g0374411 [Medicago truncatula]